MNAEATTYSGVDASRKGWIAVVVDGGGFVDALISESLRELVSDLDSSVIGIDIPIGLDSYPRRADSTAATFVGSRRSSVFQTPPRDVLEAPDYESARLVARERHSIGVSAQAFSLAPRILEADLVAREDRRVIEIHPEVSFAALAGESLEFSKKTWNGLALRLDLLAGAGIALPSDLAAAGLAGTDDVVDAAVAAWSARRHGVGESGRLPADPSRGEPVIRY